MSSRLSRSSLFAALTFIGASACDCDPVDPDGGGEASLLAQFPQGTTLESDGSTRRRILLTGLDKNRDPDTSPITVKAPTGGGFLASPVGAAEVEESLTVTPDENGRAEIEYRCVANADAAITLTADNESASTTVVLTCVPPQGDILFSFDDDNCSTLQADGVSRCEVIVTITQQTENDPILFAGEATVRVTAAADPNRVSADGSGTPNDEVVVNVVDGEGSFFVIASEVPETITVEVSVGDDSDTLDLEVDEFINRAAINVDEEIQAVGGDAVVIDISILNSVGLPPATGVQDTIDVSLAGEGATLVGAAAGEDQLLDVALDPAGTAQITVNTTAVNGAPESLLLTISYEFLPGVDPLTKTVEIFVNEEGALILNIIADPSTVSSDVVADSTSELSVTFTKDGLEVAGGTVLLTIDDPSRLTFSGGANQIEVDGTDFDADGVALVTVTAITDVSPGTVTISAAGTDGADDAVDEVIIQVQREPQLATVLPSPPSPAVLGVRGSSLPTSSVVRFTLFDDLNNPMPNIPVRFEPPDTASDVSVIGSDISDEAGVVQTILTSGTIAGPVVVTIIIDSVNPPITVSSPPIAIVGGLPNQQSSFMSCVPAPGGGENTTVSCQVTLVDRFTDVVPEQIVQFRAEGSGSNATAVTDGNGTAAQVITLDDGDTRSAASVEQWSFGFIPDGLDASFDGCDDGTATTPCRLLDICENDILECPLPPACVDRARDAGDLLEAGLLARDFVDMQAYVADFRACGYPVSCLLGDPLLANGVAGFEGDECNIPAGCLDYDPSTQCPHDGLLTVIGSTRGEEALNDGNGNGILDFEDLNGDGDQDLGEALSVRPERCIAAVACELSGDACTTDGDCSLSIQIDTFSDLPEPFLDKNDNCIRDDLTNSPRLFFSQSEKIRHTDLFSDVDGNDVFGFTVEDVIRETNTVYDEDTEIFLQSHVVVPGGSDLITGSECVPGAAGCTELAKGLGLSGIDQSGIDRNLDGAVGAVASAASETITFRWQDANGNCPSFVDSASVEVEGSIVIEGDTEVTLDDASCGTTPAQNQLTPHCEDLPGLGAPLLEVTVTADCADVDELVQQGTAKFILGGSTRTLTFTVDCPAG